MASRGCRNLVENLLKCTAYCMERVDRPTVERCALNRTESGSLVAYPPGRMKIFDAMCGSAEAPFAIERLFLSLDFS